MRPSFDEALKDVDMSYAELMEIANDIFNSVAGQTKSLIEEIRSKGESLSTDAIRNYMLKLSLNSFSFSEIKEKAAFKAQIAESVRKTEYSKAFQVSTGTNASAREAQATMQVTDQIVVEHLYTMVANMLKTTLDESHRVVDVLKSMLLSRAQEAKAAQSLSVAEF